MLTQLETQVRFGYTTVFGTNPSGGGSCAVATAGTLTDNVAPELGNAGKIKTTYDNLAWPLLAESSKPGKKFESPASYAITAATKALMNFTKPGDKYIIFITDGQEDYCDDALEICASDSTVGALQAAFAANIRTIVFGLQTTQFNLPAPSWTLSRRPARESRQCRPWRPVSMRPRSSISARASALAHRPDRVGPSDRARTDGGGGDVCDGGGTDQALQAERGGSEHAGHAAFDRAGGREELHVRPQRRQRQGDQGRHDEAGSGAREDPRGRGQLSATNGWNVLASAPTQLVFSGTACTTWRNPNSKTIDLQFPCGTIIFE